MGTHHFQPLLGLCVFLLLISQGYSDLVINSKAVLQKCTDQWTLQETRHVPRLSKMTVCLDLRLLTMGKWMAFSYTIPRSPSYELSLQGDRDAVYAWLQGVQHRFPVRLTPERWHRLCLRIDSVRKRFSLSVNSSKVVHERMVVVKALRPSGNLQLGFHPWEVCPGSSMATIELHLFRVWGDVREHSDCEDGTIVGWHSNLWKISRGQTWVQDNTLSCRHYTTTTTEAPVANSTIRSATLRTTHKSATNMSATSSHTSSMGKNVKSPTDVPKVTQSSGDSAKRSSTLLSGVTSMKSLSKVTQPTKSSSSLATSAKYTTPTSKGTQPTKGPSTMASTVTFASYPTPYPKGSTSSKGSTFKPSSAIVTVPSLIKTSTSSAPLIKDATTNPSPTKALARVTNVSMTTTSIHDATKDTTRQATHTSVSTPSTTTKAVLPSNGITKDNTRNISHNTTSNVELTSANNTTRNKSGNTTLKTSTPRKAVTTMHAIRTTIQNPLPTVKSVTTSKSRTTKDIT